MGSEGRVKKEERSRKSSHERANLREEGRKKKEME